MGFKDKLYCLRKEAGLSQARLAKLIGVSQSSVNCWEKGERTPSVEAGQKLADFFNITMEELLDLDNSKLPINTSDNKTGAIIKKRNGETLSIDRKKIVDAISKNSSFSYSDIIIREILEEILDQNQLKELNEQVSKRLSNSIQVDHAKTFPLNLSEYNQKELEEIKNFAEYIKNKRK